MQRAICEAANDCFEATILVHIPVMVTGVSDLS